MDLNVINKYRKHQMGFRASGVTVSGDCEFSEDSECFGGEIINSKILDNSMVSGTSFLHLARLQNYSKVLENAKVICSSMHDVSLVCGNSKITTSRLEGASFVTGDSVVWNSILKNNSRVSENAFVHGVELSGDTHILGTAKVIGKSTTIKYPEKLLKIHPLAFIHAGTWTRSPIVYRAQYSDFTVQECVDRKVHIGCLCQKPSKWLKAGARYGKLLGLNKNQTDELDELVIVVCLDVAMKKLPEVKG